VFPVGGEAVLDDVGIETKKNQEKEEEKDPFITENHLLFTVLGRQFVWIPVQNGKK
jgi:hypothetical protein